METCWEGGDLPPNDLKLMLSLSLATGVGPVSWHRLMEAFGSAEGVYAASTAELTTVCPHLRPDSLQAILAGPNLKAVRFQEETCQRLRVRIVSMRSEAYPDLVRHLPHPPPFLFLAGEWLPGDGRAMAVVGTRYPSSYGARMARELCLGLSEAGFTLVSGLARGIDTLAHEEALRGGSRTLAVLGSGLDLIYPPENAPLAARIAKRGALITEFPMGTAPHPTHFPRRNRIISALSLGTLVVEAGNESGALITADYALDQGREVFAVPGAVHQPGSQGTHKLIRQGAHLVERAGDILAVLQGTSLAVPARRFAAGGAGAYTDMAGTVSTESKKDSVPANLDGRRASGVGRKGGIESAIAFTPVARRPTPYETHPAEPGPMPKTSKGRAAVSPDANSLSLLELAAPVPAPTATSTALEIAASDLDEEARSLLSVLEKEPMSLDAIADKARRTPPPGSGGQRLRDAKPHRLLTGLLELELKGRVKRMPGALFRLA